MMDSFDEKRGMVKKLLDMLKEHASNEVNTGLQHPEGEGDMHGIQAERVEVLPEHEMDIPTPEHDVVTHEMHTGGIVDKVSPTVPPTMDSEMGAPDKEGAVHKEVTEPFAHRDALTTTSHQEPLDREYEDAKEEPSSMFASFLGKRKKK
jgi:hypothetical protein